RLVQTKAIRVIARGEGSKRPPLSQRARRANWEGTERGGKGLGHQQGLAVRGKTDAVGVLQTGRNPADVGAGWSGVVDTALALGRNVEGLALLGVTVDRVGKIEIALSVEDQVVGRAQSHPVTGSVEALHLAGLINTFDAAGLVVRRRADRQPVVPGKAAVVGD